MKKVIIALLITAGIIDLALCITIGLPYIIACIVADIVGAVVYKYGKNKAVIAWNLRRKILWAEILISIQQKQEMLM